MGGQRVYLCGVPEGQCNGFAFTTHNLWRGSRRAHGSREEAFRCHVRHLIAEGFTQLGPREFKAPNGGPIRILTKRSRFGAEMYWTSEKTRFMPKNPGIVIGSY